MLPCAVTYCSVLCPAHVDAFGPVYAAGGDTRGLQSAAMLIVKEDGGVWLNNDVVLRLQVDDNPEPIKELRRLVELAVRRNSFRGGRR